MRTQLPPKTISIPPFSLETYAFKIRSLCICHEACAFLLTSVIRVELDDLDKLNDMGVEFDDLDRLHKFELSWVSCMNVDKIDRMNCN